MSVYWCHCEMAEKAGGHSWVLGGILEISREGRRAVNEPRMNADSHGSRMEMGNATDGKDSRRFSAQGGRGVYICRLKFVQASRLGAQEHAKEQQPLERALAKASAKRLGQLNRRTE
jgi:hypothetical protein